MNCLSDPNVSEYKVIQKIGEGSFSEVLKCEDKQTGELYAAKRLKKIFKSMMDAMNCAEIIALHKLSRHPNVLYMIEYFYDPTSGKVVYVFELMDMSMYEFMKMKKRCLPEARIRNYLYQMLKGLEHLHKNGLFHRDIKPENILIKLQSSSSTPSYQQTEIVKLADLGSIRGIYSRPPYTEYISTRWYRSPECLLTVGYYGPKMDVWAAGCVFYEMLTLKPLFPGTNEIDQLARIHAVLGTPSARLVNKLKRKSHNCENFPRQIGTGLNSLICNFSEDGQNVLRLMVQYDPENRTNIRRLVEHRYFATLRDQYVIGQFRYHGLQRGYGGDSYAKARGDHVSVVSYLPSSERWTGNKFRTPTPEGLPKTKKSPPLSSKTFTDINYCTTDKMHRHLLRDSIGPLVTQRQFKEWGIDPAILKPRDDSRNKSKYSPPKDQHRCRHTQQKRKEIFRKTTSNLPASFKKASQVEESTQFQSKSFVLPRRVMGRVKLDTINEYCSPLSVVSRQMKQNKKQKF